MRSPIFPDMTPLGVARPVRRGNPGRSRLPAATPAHDPAAPGLEHYTRRGHGHALLDELVLELEAGGHPGEIALVGGKHEGHAGAGAPGPGGAPHPMDIALVVLGRVVVDHV